MSFEYDNYLREHRDNVRKGAEWMLDNIEWIGNSVISRIYMMKIIDKHDESKNFADEYSAYDAYFYGNNKSYAVVQDFNHAWLLHIHRNPHHWQHWVLINDDPKEGEIIIPMPLEYIVEMIADWWSFSWSKDNLNEIFNWYEERKDYIKLDGATRSTVELILREIKERLDKDKENETNKTY